MSEPTPPRFATIATSDYRPLIDRLVRSLTFVHPDSEITVFVDDASAFADLPHPQAVAVTLPSIEKVGVKRAKFDAYVEAMASGPFVYLDADVVVLQRLDELLDSPNLTACADDLSGCDWIVDRSHPWPSAPRLANKRYVNSGVLGFGAAVHDDLVQLREQVANTDFWDRHIHPGGLFDNHVLCAYLNIVDLPIRFLSERSYNWQGFRRADGTIAASLVGDQLVNVDTGEPLHLVHFAGITDVDRFLIRAPLDVARHINSRSLQAASPARAAAAVSAGRQTLDRYDADPHRATTAEVVSRAFVDAWEPSDEWSSVAYVSRPDDLVSVALAVPLSDITWNGLICGGAYLMPEEYRFLRSLIEAIDGAVVVEFGAGETTRLLGRAAHRVVSIEPFDGPWVERARAAGTDVILARLGEHGRVDDELLHRSLPTAIDLLFVDSPNGTAARTRLLAQFLEHANPARIVIHDARRDLATLAGVLAGRDYIVERTLDTHRGMTVLRGVDVAPLPLEDPESSPVEHRASVRVLAEAVRRGPSRCSVRVAVVNDSATTWPCAGDVPVRASYHLVRDGSVRVFDGIRTPLPCDLSPGDEVEFDVDVRFDEPGSDVIITLVQDGVAWFDAVDPAHAVTVATPATE